MPNRQARRLRRRLLLAGTGLITLAAAPGLARAWPARWKPNGDPFTLGVACGYPRADGFVLWTRLAPTPLLPGGGVPAEPVVVRWEIARDEQFAQPLRSGTYTATAQWAHSVHGEVCGLSAGRPYWYRFRFGEAVSPVGRAMNTATTTPTGTWPRQAWISSCMSETTSTKRARLTCAR